MIASSLAGCGDDDDGNAYQGSAMDGGLPAQASGDGDGDGNGSTSTGDGNAPDSPDGGAAPDGDAPDAAMPQPKIDAAGCPALRGAAMVYIDGLCIDRTEVTQSDYAAFLETAPDLYAQPEQCQFYGSFRPSNAGGCEGIYDPGVRGEHPVSCINWCAALAYCEWAGKRLCGKPGGGTNDGARDVAVDSEWYDACSNGGTLGWAYGDARVAGTCNDNNPNDGTRPVGTFAGCEGGYPGLFDMNDNVAEWTDECPFGNDPAGDKCPVRGGTHANNSKRCDDNTTRDREYRDDDVGLRCCATAG